MKDSGKTRYKKIAKELGIPWTAVRDRELAGLTTHEKRDQDPLNTEGWRDKQWGRR